MGHKNGSVTMGSQFGKTLTLKDTQTASFSMPVSTEESSKALDAGSMVCFETFLQPAPPFYFGNRITKELGPLLKQQKFDRVYLVTNQMLLDLYGQEVTNVLRDNGIEHHVVTIEASESTKNFATLEYLCETLVERNLSKASIVIGFGGGCLTNIVGLAAGLIFRGIRYVEMPTTLMGITDSTLSNKQAVNGRHGKNHFGMYYGPIFIFGDTQFLATEPVEGKRAAIAEGIKNGFISDPALVTYFDGKLQTKLEDYNERDLTELAYKIIQSKLKILERDPTERDYAMTLEYGHTFGHAMEFLTHGAIPHGYAVAKGMCIAAEMSHKLGHISRETVDLHYRLFGDRLGVDLSIPEDLSVEDIIQAMKTDNKKTAAGTKFVLLQEVGTCLNPDGDYQVSVSPEVVTSVLQDYKLKARNI
jgi:3-dehydroquinate synthetase